MEDDHERTRLHPAAWRLSGTAVLPKSRSHLRPYLSFLQRFLDRHDRTIDQMVQAARSGKQNIVEGCKASGTSKEMEIKLINVARASLEELLVDYQDFLRVRNLRLWDKASKEALYVRQLGHTSHVT